jgi:carbohydrate kinase (thermoresistant glucokinase family)
MRRIVVMGVSGCGKSTMAAAIANALGLGMLDGDDLHLPESVAKMRAGIALEDADRWPWLDRIGQHLTHTDGGHEAGHVVACSALKRSYRERIRRLAAPVQFVFLDGSAELIAQRMALRSGHYMHPELLASQFSALERPAADEDDVIRLDITRPVGPLLTEALAALQSARATARI